MRLPSALDGSGAGGWLGQVVACATPLHERQLPGQPVLEGGDPALVDTRMATWQAVLGDPTLLARRLDGMRMDRVHARRLLGGELISEVLPDWAGTLHTALLLTPADDSGMWDRALAETDPLPFQEVLIGFVRHARNRFGVEAGAAAQVLRGSAGVDLERQLLAHLSFVAGAVLGRDFYTYRFDRAPLAALEDAWCSRPATSEIYRGYVHLMGAGRLRDLLCRYPVLARLLARSVDQWVAGSAAMCHRLRSDREALQRAFDWPELVGEQLVTSVRTGLSDRHSGGQTVTELELVNGQRLIYKPRSVKAEGAYRSFIQSLNARATPIDLRAPRVLDCGGYGWVEAVSPAGCSTRGEVDRFYVRAGFLLSVLHVLGVTDVHCENLIAHGDQPVVVDLETLLTDKRPPQADTVLSTGLLPRPPEKPDGGRTDLSGLCAEVMQDSGVRHLAWQAPNTDQMKVVLDGGMVAHSSHRVRLAGDLPTLRDHVDHFVSGFRCGYEHLLACREAMCESADLLSQFDALPLRVLVRDTATYVRLQLHLLRPEFLGDGIDRSLQLEWLARPLTASPSLHGGRALLYEHERASMEELDVPYFSTATWRDLEKASPDDGLGIHCGRRDARVLVDRLARLSETDLEEQVAVIEQSVAARFAGRPAAPVEEADRGVPRPSHGLPAGQGSAADA